LDLK